MTRNEKRAYGLMKIHNMRLSMLIIYALIIITSIVGVTLFAVNTSEKVIQNKVSSLASSLNAQLNINLNNYLSRMENTATLAFSIDEAYNYDTTEKSIDEYNAINTEKIISDELKKICLMENFVDYGIIYRNGDTIGNISKGTKSLFGDTMFEDFESMISRKRTLDGWYTGYQDDYERIYYVKRIHDNALLVISIYTSEISDVLENPETENGMTIRLTDSKYIIMNSTAKNETGKNLPYDISRQVEGQDNSTVLGNKFLTTVNSCDVGWYVICSIPTDIIMKEKNQMQIYIYLSALLAVILAVIVGTFFTSKLTDPARIVAANLNENAHDDEFSTVSTKSAFMEKTDRILSEQKKGNAHAMILIDIDNYSEMTYNFGRSYAEGNISRLVNEIQRLFPKADCVGRISTDLFAVMIPISGKDSMISRKEISRKCAEVCTEFRSATQTDKGIFPVTVSVGTSVSPDNGMTAEQIFDCANIALFTAKKNGKDSFVIYD
ncbi:MAG: sensor domain-containing diguanylate cyclase [Ruminococcus sp.]|nr:sensor domain-containing diguanylate cyclase [Ruminococcus sp.]